jgi:hypothetical protein
MIVILRNGRLKENQVGIAERKTAQNCGFQNLSSRDAHNFTDS